MQKAETTFDKLTVFIGRNGSGKSSMLHAIVTFFTLNARITNEDFFNKNTAEAIEIEITFEDLSEQEKETFERYMDGDKLAVLKVISYDEAKCQTTEKYYANMFQIPEFANIRKLVGAKNKTDALKQLKTNKFGDIETPRSETHALELMQAYEAAHPELLKKLQVEGAFLGARNVGGGSLDNYTKLVFLPAVKEASNEVQGKGSSINQLLDTVVLQKIQNREDLLQFREDISAKIREKYSPENLGGLEEVSTIITETLKRYSPGSRLSLAWNPMQIPQVTLPSVSTTVFEDEFGGDISNKGHGLQRALILTLLEYLTFILATAKSIPKKEEDGPNTETTKPIRIDTILLIEEPEIYLHPTRARYLSKILFELANTITGRDTSVSRAQVVYTTHSTYFVGLDRFDSLRLCKKRSDGEVAFTEIIWNTLEAAAKRYEEVCGRTPEEIVRENFKVRTSNVMSSLTNEGFFADLVILVEGPSDVGVLWKLQERMGKNWDKLALAIVPAEGKEHIIRLKIIFDGLKIPNYIIFDKEVQTPRANKRLLKLMGETSDVLPQEKIHDKWAYNELNLEDELKRALSTEKYEEVWAQVQSELGCTDRIRKNIEANSRFTELAYEKGMSLPHFEAIIQKISSFYEQVKI